MMGKFIDAVNKHDLKTLKKLLKTKEYQNNTLINDEKDERGQRALHCVVFSASRESLFIMSRYQEQEHKNNQGIIDCLLKAGANVDQPNDSGETPFFIAAKYGHVGVMQGLLKAGAKLDQPNNNQETPLFAAADVSVLERDTHKVEAMNFLLKAGANVNHVAYNRTLLSKAAGCGKLKVMEILIKAGAKVDFPEGGETPIVAAVRHGKSAAMEMLLKAGAKIDQLSNSDFTLIYEAVCAARQMLASDNGATPLYCAANGGNTEAIELLLRFGAQVDQPNNDGCTPLHIAIDKNKTAAMVALIKAGAKINQPMNDGRTALYLAAQLGRTEAVNVLLEARANPYLKSRTGKLPVEIAKEKNHQGIVNLLQAYQEKNPTIVDNLSLPPKRVAPKPNGAPPVATVTQEPGVLKVSFSINPDELIVDKKLGAGGFGEVYQGTWRKHTIVAIKQLRLMQFSKEVLEDFQHEMEIMAQLRSPYIVQFYGATVVAPYRIVMEYMANGSLYHVLHSNTPLPWSTREPIALDVSKGLSYLHHQNILHRDLKKS